MQSERIKLVIFDLDGVLLDAKQIHFEALNEALGKNFEISFKEHLAKFDGLKTSDKLKILTEEKGLDKNLHSFIWKKKQTITSEKIKLIKKDSRLIKIFKYLKEKNIKVAVCSNSIKQTVEIALKRLGIIDLIDLVLSNEDVKYSKPHPEIYYKAIIYFQFFPEEVLIVEDSPVGLKAASYCTENILRIKKVKELTLNKIKHNLKKTKYMDPKWKDEKLNVLIPMAGAGSRFEKAGYTFPKPLIEVNKKPMIQYVIENLNVEANFIFVVQKSHNKKYNLRSLLNLITKDPKIVEVDGLTEGAACTALLAKEFIDNENPLFFANSDQFVEWTSNEFFYKMNETDVDGGIVTFKSTHPKWSFAKLDKNGKVIEVAEKNPISDNATVGFYYWKKGSDFVKYAEQMIEKNIRVNNEFYVCPVFNQAINDNKQILNYQIENMWGLGTPEDLDYFIKNYK